MQTKPKANSIVTSKVADDGSTITFHTKGEADLVLRLNAISVAVKAKATLMGLNARIIDKAAKSRDPITGIAATPAEKRAAMAALVDHYNTGTEDWSPAREGGIRLDGVILAAIAEATGKTLDAVKAMIEAGAAKHQITQPAYLARLGGSKVVEPILTRMRAESAADVDPDAELDAMMPGDDEEGDDTQE